MTHNPRPDTGPLEGTRASDGPIVYVVQHQHKLDKETGELSPKFNLSAAEQFGQLIFLLSPTARPFAPAPIIQQLRTSLQTFDDRDFLLLVGNPVLIGFAVAIAADFNDGRVNVLQWSGSQRTYIPIRADLVF